MPNDRRPHQELRERRTRGRSGGPPAAVRGTVPAVSKPRPELVIAAVLAALVAVVFVPLPDGAIPSLGVVVAQEGTDGAPGASAPLRATREGRGVRVSAADLARLLGASRTDRDGTLTVRLRRGVLTLFDGDSDVLWQPAGSADAERAPLSAPVSRAGGAWYVPADALPFLGADLAGETVRLVDGRRVPLELPPPAAAGRGWEIVDLGNGVNGVRLYADTERGADGPSMLLVDVAMLPIALPELRAELDASLADEALQRERLLFFVVTAPRSGPWDPSLVAVQGERAFEARHPFRLRVLRGDPRRVGPDAPALGVVLLPESFRFDRPLTLRWAGTEATVELRP